MPTQTADPVVNSPDATVLRGFDQTTQQAGTASTNGTETLQNQVRYVPRGAGAAYWGPGNLMTFLVTGKETSCAFHG